jgi:hypothetical protein
MLVSRCGGSDAAIDAQPKPVVQRAAVRSEIISTGDAEGTAVHALSGVGIPWTYSDVSRNVACRQTPLNSGVGVEFRNVERRTRPVNLQRGEKLVILLGSWDAARLVRDADSGYAIVTAPNGEPPRYYSISVFALAFTDEETIDDLVDRLTRHAADHRRFKWYCLVTESELADAGFELTLNEPPADHYDIPLGTNALDEKLASGLATLFGEEKIRMRS